MTQLSQTQYQTCQEFNATSNTRFKIDHYGDWNESYPTSDYLISQTGSYQINFDSEKKSIAVKAVSQCVNIVNNKNTQTKASNIRFYFDGNDFSNTPTIWAWISNGSAISSQQGYSWEAQQNLTFDASSGYYYWALPSAYQTELDNGLKLNFIIDKNDEFSRNESGCYSENQWYQNLSSCLDKPFKPYIGPYLTLLQPQLTGDNNTASMLDPATHMVINYELQSLNSNFTAVVHYRKIGDTNWIEQTEDNVAPLPSGWGKVHHTTLSNLQANTQYQYKVSGPNSKFSSTYSFKTAKSTMNYSRFLVVGDMQDEQGEQRWHDIVEAIADDHMDDFDFIISVGDMAKDDIEHRDERFYWWKVFFDKGQKIFASKPILPTMGNHDTPGNSHVSDSQPFWSNSEDTGSFRKYFYLSPDMSNPAYYSFQYGNACFISADSEMSVFYGRHPERDNNNGVATQATWLRQEVEKAQACTWSFAYWHVPAINPAGGKSEVEFMRPYTSYFNHKLDWVLAGHVHEYQRLKPVTASNHSLNFNKTGYGRASDKGVGYLLAAPAGQWPRNTSSSNMEQLAFYPHNSQGKVGYEIGFSIINVSANNFDLKTYGMGGVGNKVQPSGYRQGDDRSKHLLDSLNYSKVTLIANAGSDIHVKPGATVNFNATASHTLSGTIVSYQWSNNLTGVSPSKTYSDIGSYPITLTITDSQGNTASDTLIVTVAEQPLNYQKSFNNVDFRGTSNEWSQTAMNLVANHTWQIEITVSASDDNPSFKFYAGGKWYGDNQPDGKTHSNERSNISINQGVGQYLITLKDDTRQYQITKR